MENKKFSLLFQLKKKMVLSCSERTISVAKKNKFKKIMKDFIHFFRTNNQVKSQKKISKKKNFCGVVLPT